MLALSMAKKASQLKPQDIVLLLKLVANPDKSFRIMDLANELGISTAEISDGFYRLEKAMLVSPNDRKPLRENALEFLLHGLKYVFPVKLEAVSRGIPTAHSAEPLSKKIKSSVDDQYIWPYAEGEVRGHSIEPLYHSVPEACLKDENLYELLALCDGVRIGRARERVLAEKELEQRLSY